MTPAEQAKKIEQIYDEAMQKLGELAKDRQILVQERHTIIHAYIKELEAQKISAVRQSLELPDITR
jgi:hypothetical protein